MKAELQVDYVRLTPDNDQEEALLRDIIIKGPMIVDAEAVKRDYGLKLVETPPPVVVVSIGPQKGNRC